MLNATTLCQLILGVKPEVKSPDISALGTFSKCNLNVEDLITWLQGKTTLVKMHRFKII